MLQVTLSLTGCQLAKVSEEQQLWHTGLCSTGLGALGSISQLPPLNVWLLHGVSYCLF